MLKCIQKFKVSSIHIKATTGGLWSSSPPISQTLCHWSNTIKNLQDMELLHWHKVCEFGGDKLQRLPVVALNGLKFTDLRKWSAFGYVT